MDEGEPRRGEKQLLAAFQLLSGDDRRALLAFAEFLITRSDTGKAGKPVTDLPPEPRPAGESVVMAIKRLTRTYPALDRRKLMGPTSQLMSQHALQGRAAAQVIDELEIVFEAHYREIVNNE